MGKKRKKGKRMPVVFDDPVNILYEEVRQAKERFKNWDIEDAEEDEVITKRKILGALELLLEGMERHRVS